MHDYMNFKHMTGNELLINLQHCDHMTTGEMLNCLIALAKKDRDMEYPWITHPWFKNALTKYKLKLHKMNSKQLLLGSKVLHKFNIEQ